MSYLKNRTLCWTAMCAIVLQMQVFVNANDQFEKADVASRMSLWDSIDKRLVEVQFIPLSNRSANIRIRNLTSDSLNLQLPSAFAAVHVHAQMGGPPGGLGLGQGIGVGGPGGGLAAGGGAAGQALGGGFGQGNGLNGGLNGAGGLNGGLNGGGFNGGFNRGRQGGLFRVPPDAVRKFKVSTVCLEHGKPDPNPRMQYTIVPASTVVEDERVLRLCENLGSGSLSQPAAQAAAWHMASELPWTKLTKLNRVESKYTGQIRYFSKQDIRQAKIFVAACPNQSSDATSTDQSRQESTNGSLSGWFVSDGVAGGL